MNRASPERTLLTRAGIASIRVLCALGCIAVLASCSAGDPSDPVEKSQHSINESDDDRSATPLESSHFDAKCETGRQMDVDPADVNNVAVGPVTYLGARTAAEEAPPPSEGMTFFKMGAALPPHTVATVTVVETTVPGAVIQVENGPEIGTRSVTYRNCEDGALAWVGGLVLQGKDSGCVTLEVVSDSEATPQRVHIPLNTSACD